MSRNFKQIHFLGTVQQPLLEILKPSGQKHVLPFIKENRRRDSNEQWWSAKTGFTGNSKWNFRIILNGIPVFPQLPRKYHATDLEELWFQDGELFNYQPPSLISPSKVCKKREFRGILSTRPLYIYTPRGYIENKNHSYPVIYMHDGQNCFESFVKDSFAGSWRAEEAADFSIGQGLMKECIIVGVSHGKEERLWEYLPPYAHYPQEKKEAEKPGNPPVLPQQGRADRTLKYYRDCVAPYIGENYRVLKNRNDTATCGSSMGGLFSSYIAWEFPQFAGQHAIVSPSYWITSNESGALEGIEIILSSKKRREVRLWLDSGTRYGADYGDDGMHDTKKVRDAFLKLGYRQGKDFQYHLAEGALHQESAWAARLPSIFQFLFPLN
ncbi:MAG: alpha/beta hydrolase [SAR324 cluster bacterium]|nr:alpha/beta hydrolase [SAR324 cluster bacterium]